MARKATGLCSIVVVDKPSDLTSHDLVNVLRRTTGERRIGHAGTLDPFATGVLVLGIGCATRLADWIHTKPKSYISKISFGIQTDTDDLTGRSISNNAVPECVFDQYFAANIIEKFVGSQMQLPPQYSAKKIEGKHAYDLARQGIDVELSKSKITVYGAQLISLGVEPSFGQDLPFWEVAWQVSKGTYIRALARDLGQIIGCGAHLSSLRRTSVAGATLEDAILIDEIKNIGVPVLGKHIDESVLATISANPLKVLDMPVVEVDECEFKKVQNGAPIDVGLPENITFEDLEDSKFSIAIVFNSRLHAIYSLDKSKDREPLSTMVNRGCRLKLKSSCVIPDGVINAF